MVAGGTRIRLWSSLFVLAFFVAACSVGEQGASETTEGATDTTAAVDTTVTTDGPTTTEGEEPEAGDPIPITIGSLSFPSLVVPIPPIMEAQGIDAEHGLDVTIEPFADIGAFYAAQTNGSVDVSVGGPNVYQRLIGEGADIQIISTYVGLKPLLVITEDPEIESIDDLAGKSIAATVASAEYQILAIYANSKGVDLEQDATLINGSPADVRTQLEAGRVDAGMLWDPGAALALQDNPDYRIIFNGDDAWRELTGQRGYELVWGMQRSFIQEHPEAVEAFIAAVQESVDWLFDNPEQAAPIMEEASGMPADLFIEVLNQGRVDYDVRPAWEEEVRSSLVTHFERAVEAGFLESMPPEDIIYEPSS